MPKFEAKEKYLINDLLEIIKILRGEDGCPWDIEQTHLSIKMNFIEEAYEVLEAIELNDTALLREELGDVLLQVAFHCQIEVEAGSFNFDDVCDEVCRKLILRHPHVFGNADAANTAEVLENWENIKKSSKGQKTYTDTLKSIAKSYPALMYAQKISKKAALAGLDFKSAGNVFGHIRENLAALENAAQDENSAESEKILGDLLFSCVEAAQFLKVDAEDALLKSAAEFISRFEHTEKLIWQQGIEMQSPEHR